MASPASRRPSHSKAPVGQLHGAKLTPAQRIAKTLRFYSAPLVVEFPVAITTIGRPSAAAAAAASSEAVLHAVTEGVNPIKTEPE